MKNVESLPVLCEFKNDKKVLGIYFKFNKFHKFMKSGRIYKVARLAGIETKDKEEKDVRKKDGNKHKFN